MDMRTWNIEMGILTGNNMLKNTKGYINEDYPREIMDQRKQLVKHMKDAREKGYRADIHYGKLQINSDLWELEQMERNRDNRNDLK